MKYVSSLIALFIASYAFAASEVPQTFTLDGRLYSDTAGTTPLTDTHVDLVFQILNNSQTCILYEESRTSFDAGASNGFFAFQIGSVTGDSKRSANDSGFTMKQIYSNVPQAGLNGKLLANPVTPCAHTPAAGDQRYLRVLVTPSDNTTRILSPNMAIDSVPNAVIAEHAETAAKVGTFGPADLLRVNTAGAQALSQANLENVFTTSNYSILTALLAGTSTLYNKPAANGTSVLPNLASPAAPSAGQIWYNAGNVYYHDGTSTKTISTGSSTSVAAADGTAGAPSISFGSDPDTGWYLAAANNLAAATAGAERVRINENGNLGIGSSAPGARLTLGGDMSASAWQAGGIGIRQNSANYTDTSSSGTVGFNYVNAFGVPTLIASSATTYTNASTFSMYPPVPGANVTLTNSTALTINSTALTGGGGVTNGYGLQVNAPTGATNNYAATFMGGNVGIGTSAPDVPLMVSGTGPGQLRIHRAVSTLSATNNILMSALDSTSSPTSYAAISSLIKDATDGSEDGAFAIHTQTSGALTEKVRVDETGSVGIGTTAPTAKLHLAAGTATAGTAPLKLTAGVNLTTPEDGAMEYSSGALYFTIGSTRYTIPLNGSTGTYTDVSNITNSAGNITLSPVATTGAVVIDSGTTATSHLTGALRVSGGVGVTGDIYANGSLNTNSYLSVGTNAFIPQIYGSASAGGDIKIDGTSDATKGDVLLNSAGGNVGIGTTAPISAEGRALHVYNSLNDGTVASNAAIFAQSENRSAVIASVSAPTAAGVFAFRNTSPNTTTGQGMLLYNHTDKKMQFFTDNAVRGVIDATGNYGIGTTSPASLLNVSSDAASNAIFLDSFGNGTNPTAQFTGRSARGPRSNPTQILADDNLAFFGGRGYTNAPGWATGSSAGMFFKASQNYTSGAQGGYITFETTADNSAATSRAERMRIAQNGLVGIGTTSPTSTLHVKSAGAAGGAIRVDNVNAATQSSLVFAEQGATKWSIGKQGDNSFFMWDSDNSRDFLRVASGNIMLNPMGGNLGVGNSAPTAKLHLAAGTAAAGTAPLKLTQGVNLTTPEAGAIEYDGTNLYYTDSTNTRRTLSYSGSGGSAGSGTSTSQFVINSDSDNAGSDGGVLFQRNGSTIASISNGGRMLTGVGDASNPGFSFQNDPNTGMQNTAGDTVSIITGAVEAMRFNTVVSGVNYVAVTPAATGASPTISTAGADTDINLTFTPKGTGSTIFNGNVGIGTTAPARRLALVAPAADLNATMRLTSGDATNNSSAGIEFMDSNGTNRGHLSVSGSGNMYLNAGNSFNISPGTTGSSVNQGFVRFSVNSNGDTVTGGGSVIERLNVHQIAASNSFAAFTSNAAGSTATDGVRVGMDSSSNAVFMNKENAAMMLGTNNTERVRIDASGNVGVGTTSPTRKFHVDGTIKSSGNDANYTTANWSRNIELENVGAITWLKEGGDKSWGIGKTGAASKFFIFSSTADDDSAAPEYHFTIDNIGRVGVGLTSPSAGLHLKAGTATAGTAPLKLTAGANLTTPEPGAIEYDGTSLYYTDSGGTRRTLSYSGGGGGVTGSGTTGAIPKFTAAGAIGDSVIFESGSNVGIGTTSPGTKLEVNGTAKASIVHAGIGTNATASAVQVGVGDSNTGFFRPANNNIGISTAGTEKLRIDGSGNVGIGTTSPAAKLNVDGGQTFLRYNSNTDYALKVDNGGGNALGVEITGGANSATPLLYVHSDYTGGGGNRDGLTVLSSGNVGIGTTAPAVKLDVAGTLRIGDGGELCPAAGAGALKWAGTEVHFCNGTTWAALGGGSGVGGSGTTGAIPKFTASGTIGDSVMTESSGRVGLGTTVPQSNIHIHSGAGSAIQFTDGTTGDATWADGVRVSLGNSKDLNLTASETGGNINFSANGYVLTTNNVGIGSTAPVVKLHTLVGSAAPASSGSTPSAGTAIRVENNVGNGVLDIGTNNSNQWIQSTNKGSLGSGLGLWLNPRGGNVGIGVTATPTEALQVNGNVLATAYLYSSDKRLKKDIEPLDDSLEKLLTLSPVKYRWIMPTNSSADREQIGLIAQEVREVYPQAVREDKEGWLRVDYPALVAPLVKAVQELYAQIFDVKGSVDTLQVQSSEHDRSIASLKEEGAAKDKEIEKLKQENEEMKARLDRIEKMMSEKMLKEKQ